MEPTPTPVRRSLDQALPLSGYFACMFSDGGGYWRHEGWGEPAAFNNVVHLVYAQHGAGSDPGDVYYIRSTDGGVTFAAPFKLNTDATTRPQWQPNLSVSPTGTLLATWYDARDSARAARVVAQAFRVTGCTRESLTTTAPAGCQTTRSRTLSLHSPPKTIPEFKPTYAGDYDYGSAIDYQARYFMDRRARGHYRHISAGRLHR